MLDTISSVLLEGVTGGTQLPAERPQYDPGAGIIAVGAGIGSLAGSLPDRTPVEPRKHGCGHAQQ